MSQTALRKGILQSRTRTTGNRYFIPASALQQIVTKDAIRVALSTHNYPLHRRQEALDYVINGGKRVFGILVVMGKLQLLINFIEHDPLHLVQLDAKLPLHESALRKILPEDSVEFFGLQWEFCSPIFGPKDYLHRVYDDEMILPFLEEHPSEVGYAHMTLPTVVHASHLPHMQHSGKSQISVMRKRFICGERDFIFKNEDRILSLLQSLDHPNIIKLLASYTLQGAHNLLFPLASGDLAGLFSSPRPSTFHSDPAFFHALNGLSSALESLHNFKFGDYPMVGCHFDISPTNILVDGGNFLLADFGYSRLCSVDESADVMFRGATYDYIGPECETIGGGYAHGHLVGTSSDIWSFGCVIAEVATYMMRGPGSVEEFRKHRAKTLFGKITLYQFCHASEACPKVVQWLDDMGKDAGEEIGMLLRLVRRMLKVVPGERPDANGVMSALSEICGAPPLLTSYNITL